MRNSLKEMLVIAVCVSLGDMLAADTTLMPDAVPLPRVRPPDYILEHWPPVPKEMDDREKEWRGNHIEPITPPPPLPLWPLAPRVWRLSSTKLPELFDPSSYTPAGETVTQSHAR